MPKGSSFRPREARAGIQGARLLPNLAWIPEFAGMTQALGSFSLCTQVDGRFLFALVFGQILVPRQVLLGLLSLVQSAI